MALFLMPTLAPLLLLVISGSSILFPNAKSIDLFGLLLYTTRARADGLDLGYDSLVGCCTKYMFGGKSGIARFSAESFAYLYSRFDGACIKLKL